MKLKPKKVLRRLNKAHKLLTASRWDIFSHGCNCNLETADKAIQDAKKEISNAEKQIGYYLEIKATQVRETI